MARLRLTSVLVAVLALSGAWAMPARQAESTRLVASIACVSDEAARRQVRPVRLQVTSLVQRIAPAPLPRTSPARTLPLPHALYQRPPPRR